MKIFLMVHLLFHMRKRNSIRASFVPDLIQVAAPVGQQDGTNAHSSVVHLAADVSYMSAEIVGGVQSAALSFRGTSIAVFSRGALSMMPTSFASVPEGDRAMGPSISKNSKDATWRIAIDARPTIGNAGYRARSDRLVASLGDIQGPCREASARRLQPA
jgi:hypothetical protein